MKLFEILEEKGVTAAELHRATGIRQSTLSNIKKRESGLSLENALRIADYLKIDVRELRK